ncbi:MAG TPA: hypothetical protein ENG12_02750 [Candidatus Altiarchaeales archaeon]|nr:hypothetical protein [Candidatus Altiarchaeales archaeon]
MDYEGEWNWGRIAFVLIILIAFAFSVYYLFFQPREVEPVNNNKCDPFPAKIDRYVCDGINKSIVMDKKYLLVCDKYDDEGNCIKQDLVSPKRVYFVRYNNPETRTDMDCLLITFETRGDAERFFEKNFGSVDDPCQDISQSLSKIDGQCIDITTNGAKGFYLDGTGERVFFLLDENNFIKVGSRIRREGLRNISQENLPGPLELKQLIEGAKE